MGTLHSHLEDQHKCRSFFLLSTRSFYSGTLVVNRYCGSTLEEALKTARYHYYMAAHIRPLTLLETIEYCTKNSLDVQKVLTDATYLC